MLNMYPRHQLQSSSVVDDGGDEKVEADGGYNPFYGIAVVCVSLFLFCVLAASVSAFQALAYTALAALLLGVAGCFAPKGWFGPSGRRGASAELVVVTVTVTAETAGPAVPGHPCAALVNVPPAFAFQCAVESGGEGDEVAASASCVVCSVCLEDVRCGEMVREVQACRHVFHVTCIDMWLHSHRTCPMCRCLVSLPVSPKVTTKDATATEEVAPESDRS
jgi:hypothetical protein